MARSLLLSFLTAGFFQSAFGKYVGIYRRNDTESHAHGLLHESMDWMDRYYDAEVGYLYSDNTALSHNTRASGWYAAGLLARNEDSDKEEAAKIIRNIIGAQFKDVEDQWFGDYQKYPEEPTVGIPQYPPVIYNSWDPNWRGFVATTFIVILEEFPNLLSYDLKEYMMESLLNATIGDSYRVGGVNSDNLYPAYSNPSIMRALVSGWVGRRLNATNETAAGEMYAKEIIDLFNRDNTLSEFNSGTYAGVSLFALTLWAKYMPTSSVMGQNGGRMITHTWNSLGQLYNANLKNVAGPWDRSYGFDMNRYLSIFALQIWTLVGKEKAPVISRPYLMSHNGDFSISPLVAILAPFHNTLVDNSTIESFKTFPGTHSVKTSAFSPPFDTYPRNITAWLSDNLTIGAETFSGNVVGGPAINPSSFNPAVVQWARKDGTVGFLSLYAQVKELTAVAGKKSLNLTYPSENSTNAFSFLVGTNSRFGKRDVASWEDVEGVDVTASGTVNLNYTVTFNGMNGGAGKVVNDFEFWNFTYAMPSGSSETPHIQLQFELA
ncbi:hypothetical protein P154DRAFT_525946 [Amniculicola lignicola CBS 123094]|uniref:DUF1793-domain-containing protein n=1 Tax=Amniculicola lignicola CBS 123094 TaxID=1392246 RepID=A0A6A5W9P7_9PLEO|nr:hypothetical protein P154DRAFT_525946 [Amniculicola lignicola CBS 123094]